jgi:hypothetical protein
VILEPVELPPFSRTILSASSKKLIRKPYIFDTPLQFFFSIDPGNVLPVLTSSFFVFRHETPPLLECSYRSYLGRRTDNRGHGRVAESGHYQVKRDSMIYGTSAHSGEVGIFGTDRGASITEFVLLLTGSHRSPDGRFLENVRSSQASSWHKKAHPSSGVGLQRQPMETFRVAG